MIGNARPSGRLATVVVIGNHRHDLGIEPADTDLVKKMQKRMVKPGDHDDNLLRLSTVDQPPLHLKLSKDWRQTAFDQISRRLARWVKRDPHEEAVGSAVPILAAFNDVGS